MPDPVAAKMDTVPCLPMACCQPTSVRNKYLALEVTVWWATGLGLDRKSMNRNKETIGPIRKLLCRIINLYHVSRFEILQVFIQCQVLPKILCSTGENIWHDTWHETRTLNKTGGEIMYYGSFHLSGLIRTWVCQEKISLPHVRSEIVGSRTGMASIHTFTGTIRKSTVPTWQAWLGHKAQGRRRVTTIRVGFSFLKFNFLHRT